MLIIGCGDVGRCVAQRALAGGASVRCVVRSAASAARLRRAGLAAEVCDLDDDRQSLNVGAEARVFYFAPPPRRGREDTRVGRFLSTLPADHRPRIVYISTTGVYGDCHGDWVDETRPVGPTVDRARRRLDAERRLLAWRAAAGGELVILRVAGIYGPGKLPVERLRRCEPMVGQDEAPWTNRIHIFDLMQVCEAAMARGRDGEIYNVSDGQPGNMRDYFDRVADLHGLPRAPSVRIDAAAGALSPGMLSYLKESRRVDNRKMLDDLGVRLRYPTLDRGLAACARGADASETG